MSSLFDTLEYTQGAEKVGIKREHAEYQARQLAKLVDEQLVDKSHLDIKLKELEMRIVIKVGAMMVVQSGLLLTVLGFLIKHT
jgi:hypothetical protein